MFYTDEIYENEIFIAPRDLPLSTLYLERVIKPNRAFSSNLSY